MAKSGLGLGKGLGALIPEAEVKAETSINEVDIELIDANPWQPRNDFDQQELDELAASIKAVGLIQPITLRKVGERYQIIAGERRFRATKIAGIPTIPAYIREVEDTNMLLLAILENTKRSDLNPIEESLSYQRLMDECKLTQEEVAERVGKSRSAVANFLRLLKLPAEIQAGLREKQIAVGHARAILGVDNTDMQLEIYKQVVENNYSVRQVEELVEQYNNPVASDENGSEVNSGGKKKSKRKQLDPIYEDMRTNLSKCFGTSVKFDCNPEGKGKITIPFGSAEELERVMSVLDRIK